MSAPQPYAHRVTNGSPWNFNAGPGALPPEVLAKAAANLQQHGGPFPQGTGISVMSMSHRSAAFESIMSTALKNCRELLQVPDTHTVLFLHGGGTGGFSSVPLNLAASNDTVAYAVTGWWSAAAAKEAAKFAKVDVVVDGKDAAGKYSSIPDASTWKASPNAKYLHVCYNETQHGLAFPAPPATDLPLVADLSSCFMSEPVDVSKFAVIYAGAHKNVGPAGVTVYIVRKDLIKAGAQPSCPAIFDWALYEKAGSMYNTPCCWSIYVMGLVFEWINERGGVEGMKKLATQKAKIIYDFIDNSNGYYKARVPPSEYRSKTNICFSVASADGKGENADLNSKFVAESEAAGFVGLQGHRNVGALRASVYNGMTVEGCEALVGFMAEFAQRNPQQ